MMELIAIVDREINDLIFVTRTLLLIYAMVIIVVVITAIARKG